MIIFKEQVNFDLLTNQKGIHVSLLDHDTQGHFVLRFVQTIAEKSQKNVQKILQENNIDFDSFYVENFIAAYNVPESLIRQLAIKSDIWQIQDNSQLHQRNLSLG